MFSWWNRPVNDAPSAGTTVRSVIKTQQQHIEVIGGPGADGSKTPAGHLPRSSFKTRRAVKVNDVKGPPRLPNELFAYIITLASQAIVDDGERQQRRSAHELLTLAQINESALEIVFTRFILPDLTLTGERQVELFARSLTRNTLKIRKIAHRVRRLAILRSPKSISQEQQQSHARQSVALYGDVDETARFERTTLAPLRVILSHCGGLKSLSLAMTARVLDLRWPDDLSDKGNLISLCTSLEQLTTMLSLYGGDLNERLWDPTYGGKDLRSSRWQNLTHLQLHGPRFRMTASTALALSDLPSLTHLALIMPWVIAINPQYTDNAEYASDALGRQSVFQVLLSGLGHRLETLLLVCHDMDGYLGSVQKLGGWFRALHWRRRIASSVAPHFEQTEKRHHPASSKTQLVLVTAHVGAATATDVQAEPHPTFLSNWMLERAQKGRQWTFEDGEQDTMFDTSVVLSVESWRTPSVDAEAGSQHLPFSEGNPASPSSHSPESRSSPTGINQSERWGSRLNPMRELADRDGGLDDLD